MQATTTYNTNALTQKMADDGFIESIQH